MIFFLVFLVVFTTTTLGSATASDDLEPSSFGQYDAVSRQRSLAHSINVDESGAEVMCRKCAVELAMGVQSIPGSMSLGQRSHCNDCQQLLMTHSGSDSRVASMEGHMSLRTVSSASCVFKRDIHSLAEDNNRRHEHVEHGHEQAEDGSEQVEDRATVAAATIADMKLTGVERGSAVFGGLNPLTTDDGNDFVVYWQNDAYYNDARNDVRNDAHDSDDNFRAVSRISVDFTAPNGGDNIDDGSEHLDVANVTEEGNGCKCECGLALAKTISWRIIATSTTLSLSYIVLGDLEKSALIAIIDTIAKFVFYFAHEKVWECCKDDFERHVCGLCLKEEDEENAFGDESDDRRNAVVVEETDEHSDGAQMDEENGEGQRGRLQIDGIPEEV